MLLQMEAAINAVVQAVSTNMTPCVLMLSETC